MAQNKAMTVSEVRTLLLKACNAHGSRLDGYLTHEGEPVQGSALLWTISGLESDYGRLWAYSRHEPAYMPGGKYYRHGAVKALWKTYGILAACSMGPMQVMVPTAYEVGYKGLAFDLVWPGTSVEVATTLIRKRFILHDGAETLSDVLDAYNSGNHKDNIEPFKYISKGRAAYVKNTTTWSSILALHLPKDRT